ncbi:MAG: transcription elongation factor GreA [Nitriliruptoraceae bacterium]
MSATYLSQDAYTRLKAELDELKTSGREQISHEIEVARAHGDLRENAEYHAAKDEQGRMEARIRQLEELLRDVTIGEPASAEVAAAGVVVTLDIDGDVETYLLGSREDHHDDFEILSTESPMGQAVLGAKQGDTVAFETPTGVTIDLTVTALALP